MNRSRYVLATTMGIGLLASIATSAQAAFLLRTALVRVAGEDPSVSAACPAAGDARFDGVRIRVTLSNMDPARFPGTGCQTEVRVGGIAAVGVPVVVAPALDCIPAVPASSVDFRTAGLVTAGSRVQVRVRCSVNGVRHETQWAGTL